MKKILTIILIMVLALPIVSAEETYAGTTPDSPLWGVDVAIERIQLALTFDNAKKAKLRLKFAEERLQEVNAMITANKIQHAKKAKLKHEEHMKNIKTDITQLRGTDNIEELNKRAEIEALLDNHKLKIEDNSQKIETQLKLITSPEGTLTQTRNIFTNMVQQINMTRTEATQLRIKVTERITEQLQEQNIDRPEKEAEQLTNIALDKARLMAVAR